MLPATSILDRQENRQHNGRLLIVDDDYTTLALMKRLFMSDYELFTATNGEEALALLEHTPVDLVLMDVVMPKINGFQAPRQITKNPSTSHIPIIIVTTKDQETDRIWGARQGAKSYVVKPVEEATLLAAISQYLPQ